MTERDGPTGTGTSSATGAEAAQPADTDATRTSGRVEAAVASPTGRDATAGDSPRAAKGIDRATLEAERDFLLCSLADLDAELATGEVTRAQFDELTSRYTARAAAVLRTLDRVGTARSETTNDPPGHHRRRRLATVAVLVAVVALAAGLLPAAIGDREAGQTITGNAQSAGEPSADALARNVEQNPEDPQFRLAYARFLFDRGELTDAIRHYDAAVRLDPDNPEALAYSGWILAVAGGSGSRADFIDSGMARIDQAIASDPNYPDAHALRGLVLVNTGDPVGAIPELDRYLELAPDGPLRGDVEALLDQARRQAASDPP